MIENPPKTLSQTSLPTDALFKMLTNPENNGLFEKIEREYLYWDKIKYMSPGGVRPEDLWAAVKLIRQTSAKSVKFGNYRFLFKETNYMQQKLHEFDMNFGGTFSGSMAVSGKNRQYYLLSSIMEEAIASSQMEGANTTRKAAKEMLRKQEKPKDKSQQMIFNNYSTIRFLSEHKNETLTPELLLEIHRRISEKTLDDAANEGRFRTDDTIFVVNGITGEIAHEPPSHTQIEPLVRQLCDFANNDEAFIHPIIKAIIIHFMISFLHPFADGNGRTARSLFYWYMLKKGYRMTEFLSISRIIYKKKNQYEKAFLYTEHDDFDLNYFIQYNITVLNEAFDELKLYLERKSVENNALLEFKTIPGINERQAHILKMIQEQPGSIFECKNLINVLGVSIKTVRADLEGLVERGFMIKVPINRRLVGYAKSETFEADINGNSGN